MQNKNGSEKAVSLFGFDIKGLPHPDKCPNCPIAQRAAQELNEIFPLGEEVTVRTGDDSWRVAVSGSEVVTTLVARVPTKDNDCPEPIKASLDSEACCGHRTVTTNCSKFCNEVGQLIRPSEAKVEEEINPYTGSVSSASFQVTGF